MKFPWLQNENSAASHPLLKVCKQSYLDNQITDWSAKVYCTPRQTHMLLLVGFTVPSGYNNRRGVKAWQVLYKRVAFTAFVVPDSFISTDVLNNCSASTVYNQGQSLSFFLFIQLISLRIWSNLLHCQQSHEYCLKNDASLSIYCRRVNFKI